METESAAAAAPSPTPDPRPARWAKVIDHDVCIGCHACTTACKSENEVPLSVTRTYVKYVDVGQFPQARRAFQVTRCNQCEDAPCVNACPTSAMYRRPDGIVDFAKSSCIGCKACIAACPYDAIFINPEDGAAEKCNFCAHRLEIGLEPACAVVCPTEAILVGDLDDESSRVSQLVHREAVSVRRPEKGTRPRLFYRGAHAATLDPLAAAQPGGGLFMWSEQTAGGQHVVSGMPPELAPGGDGRSGAPANSSAAALLSYDVPHRAPWGWMVSLYTLTKGIAAGVYLVALLLLLAGRLSPESALWRWTTPVVAGIFLAVTGALLIGDLKRPTKFYLIFTRPQWGSWLVRGAFLIAGYSLLLALHFGSVVLTGSAPPLSLLAILGIPLAAMTAVYTAFLFAQAKGRDLWQSSLLPPHLVVQAALAGAATLLLAAPLAGGSPPIAPLAVLVAGTCLLHLLLVLGEISLPHGTAHARLAVAHMLRGRFRRYFWAGTLLVAVGAFTPWLGAPAALAALIGLGAYEHAHVQAAQAVPLA